jgi:hypothetical protein
MSAAVVMIPETATVDSEVLVRALAMLGAVGDVVPAIAETVWQAAEDVRRPAFGFPLDDNHPVLVRLDELTEKMGDELEKLLQPGKEALAEQIRGAAARLREMSDRIDAAA